MDMNNSPIMYLRLVLFTFKYLFWPVVSDGAQNPQFTPIQCNNTFICAVSQPLTFLYSVLSVTTCATECNFKQYQSASCVGFNYRATNYSCEFFTGDPIFFGVQDGCQYYQNTRYPNGNCTTISGLQMGTLVTSWAAAYPVAAIVLLNAQMCVSYEGAAQVSVHDTVSFQLLRNITFPGLGRNLYGLATTAINNSNYLYISDTDNTCVHRVDLKVTSTISVMTWSLPSSSQGLSATSNGNVLASINNNLIIEYTPGGSVVRRVNTGVNTRMAIEVNKDVWAFISKSPVDKLCTVLAKNGTLVKCFGSPGSGMTQLSNPMGMNVDDHGYFFIADSGNNRISVVDPSLTFVRLLQLPVNQILQGPRPITFDHSRGRLYIGERDGQQRVLVFDGIW